MIARLIGHNGSSIRPNMQRKVGGFTIIEMMVTISVFLIVISVAGTSYQSLMTNMRMKSEINDLLASLRFARSEAMKRGQIVSVCPASSGSCGSTTNWTGGRYTIVNASSTILENVAGPTHGDTLKSTVASYPTFNPAGYTFYAGTIYLHDANNTQQRCIVFNAGAWTIGKGASCP